MRPSSPLPASLAFQETTPPSWGGVLAGGSGVRRPKLPLLGAQVLVVVVGGVRGGLVLPARGGRRTAVEASRGGGGGFALRKGATFFWQVNEVPFYMYELCTMQGGAHAK